MNKQNKDNKQDKQICARKYQVRKKIREREMQSFCFTSKNIFWYKGSAVHWSWLVKLRSGLVKKLLRQPDWSST